MPRIFLASHGHLASGMKSSLALFMHVDERVTAYDAYVEGEGEGGLRAALDAFFEGLEPGEEALLLADIYGGSVSSVMARYLDRPGTRLIAGVNLAFLMEAASSSSLDDRELDAALEAARGSLRRVHLDDGVPAPANGADDFF